MLRNRKKKDINSVAASEMYFKLLCFDDRK